MPMTNFHSRQNVNYQQGFTLVELIIVIVLVGILAVTAGPRIFGSGGVDQVVTERQLISLLRLQQQRAMQDMANPCYGISITSAQVSPVECGASINAARLIPLPSANGINVVSSISGAATGFYFNALGCPVSTNHATVAESCGQSSVEIQMTGANARQICVQSQGYIRPGACS
ncbi:MAG: type II secretion system protein [Gammaproteobacteria bacterium]|jgi:MSHA pilin protein MshC|nr:type II secretion system protein [Gammaproteobacteria bacterium]